MYLFVYAGLVTAARNESELAGVITHEISHFTARHAARMASRGTKHSIIRLATFISRSLYAWETGYGPEGNITFFDWMATKEGCASRTSFFATHPAFGDRTIAALKEYKALASLDTQRKYITDTQQFEEIKERLYKPKEPIQEEETNRPSLLKGVVTEEDCAAILAGKSQPPPENQRIGGGMESRPSRMRSTFMSRCRGRRGLILTLTVPSDKFFEQQAQKSVMM